MPAILTASTCDLLIELNQYRKQRPPGADGALASFLGSMRDFNIKSEVVSMSLDHYPEMTQRFLDSLCTEVQARWKLNDILIVHRYGDLKPGDDIVLVACWSAHRAEAFDACRHAMEELKRRAPFWKKEITAAGERWVHDAQRTEGQD